MTDNRHYPKPGHGNSLRYLIIVDLDDRSPLTDEQADALNTDLHRMIRARSKLDEDIRKTSQRIVLSGEAKVKAARDGS